MHDPRSVSIHLGMNIESNQKYHTIDIHQHSYILMIFANSRMDESRPLAMPMALQFHKRLPDKEACDPTIYESILQSLMYAMTTTRPDIAYAIGVLSWYNHNLCHENMVALKRVFRYLNGTKDWRLCFGGALGGTLQGESTLGCYVNSDYAGCLDDYKSTSGLVITVRGVVDW